MSVDIRIITKEERCHFLGTDALLAGVCIPRKPTNKEEMYEKTSFTSIGSNSTGSGSDATS
jgi:hypothetical protein